MAEERRDSSTTDLAGRAEDSASAHEDADAPLARDAAEEQTYGDDTTGAEPTTPLFTTEDTEGFRRRWAEIQTSFVDRPRESVEQGDRLVADVLQQLTTQFSDERSRLEAQWDRGEDASTEELRVALTRYRSFFERLLAA